MKLFIFFFLAFASFAQAQHVIIGRDALPINGETVTDNMLFYDDAKYAFRGGRLYLSKNWAPDSIGSGSFAYGLNVKATGNHSFAFGSGIVASGNSSFASGSSTTASGYQSNASGSSTTASGYISIASGNQTIASGSSSFTSGTSTTASGSSSNASGSLTTASGITSFASGNQTTASGQNSFSSGYKTIALGNSSFVSGNQTVAPSYTEFSIGSFNTEYTPINNYQWNLNERLFVIGNGTTDVLRSDAMVVLKNGDVSFPDGNLIVGRDAAPSNGETVTDEMLFYDDAKYAFRGGLLNSSKNWAPDSIGLGSFAYGFNVKAKGNYSCAIGLATLASGHNSFSSGSYTTASGNFSFASGSYARASASGSFASGSTTVASGLVSFASGSGTTASGNYSFASGGASQASGNFSFAAGLRTIAPSYAEFAIGSYNTDYTPNNTEAWNANDRLFVIGNGQSNSLSDAMIVLKNGNTAINGNLNLKGESTIEAVNSASDAILYTKSGTSPATRVILHQKTTEDIFIGDLDGRGGNLRLRSNGEDRLVITSAGNIAVKDGDLLTNTSTNNLGRSGNCWNQAFLINGINDCSDQRLKKNIVNLDYGLATIAALRPVSYEWRENNVGIKLGLIAQEVQEIVPEVVHIPENPEEFMSINYTELIPVLISAMKEQNDLIEKQQETINDLQKEITSLKSGKVQSEDRFRSLEAKLDALISGLNQKSQD